MRASWRGPWRWYGEELLDCCAPLDRVKQEGITFDQFACLARCNGATVEPRRASDGSLEGLRAATGEAASAPEGRVLAIASTRRALGRGTPRSGSRGRGLTRCACSATLARG